MGDISLQFLSNEADEDEGLGHAGIETFKDAPYASTARECGQNSADAKISKPVRIDFDLIEIKLNDLPAVEKFAETIDCCLEKSRKADDEKGIDFFERANGLLEEETIRVLKISDFNTMGLKGPCELGTPFHSLVKSTGVSRKELDTSGGSFGIGKNAAFAISDLQTVFYSTVYKDDEGSDKFLTQGKSLLISHADKNGDARRQTGYWGGESFSPIDTEACAPAWLRRDEQGTSIFAVGFREVGNWNYRMAASLIRNFFTAIHRGEMEFNLSGGDIQITSKTLSALFQDENIRNAASDSNQLDEFVYSSSLYECLVSEESKDIDLNIDGLGAIRIKLLIKEKMPKRLSIIRNGMVITDSLEQFGDKFAQFPMCKEFVALVEPLDKEGSSLIKTLENPKHDGVSAERVSDKVKREKAILVMRKLAREIRTAIKERTRSALEEVQALDELAEFFADVEENQSIPDPASDDDPENVVIKPKPRPKPAKPSPISGGVDREGGSGDENNSTDGTTAGDGSGAGAGTGGAGGAIRKKYVQLNETRNIIIDPRKASSRKVWFTPAETCEINLNVFATGINSVDRIDVQGASIGEVYEGVISLSVEEDKRLEIELVFNEEYNGPIELAAFTMEGETSEN